jgi:hypothetical protein
MMGQPRQRRNTYSVEDDLEEEERHGAGYKDEPKRESYLPDSVHGSQCHLSALANFPRVGIGRHMDSSQK